MSIRLFVKVATDEQLSASAIRNLSPGMRHQSLWDAGYLHGLGYAELFGLEDLPAATNKWELPEAIWNKQPGAWFKQWQAIEKPLADIKSQRKGEINSQRAVMLSSDKLVLKTPDQTPWSYNQGSLDVLKETLLMYLFNPAPESLPPIWRDHNNVGHPCTLQLLQSIAARYQSYKAEIFGISWFLKDIVLDPTVTTGASVYQADWVDYLSPENGPAALACIDQIYPEV